MTDKEYIKDILFRAYLVDIDQDIELITNENSFSYITNVASLSNEQLHTIICDGATIGTVLYNSYPVLILHFPKNIKPDYSMLSGVCYITPNVLMNTDITKLPVKETIYKTSWWIDAPKSWSMGVQLINLAHECGVSIIDLTENTYGFIFKSTRTSITVEGNDSSTRRFKESIRKFRDML